MGAPTSLTAGASLGAGGGSEEWTRIKIGGNCPAPPPPAACWLSGGLARCGRVRDSVLRRGLRAPGWSPSGSFQGALESRWTHIRVHPSPHRATATPALTRLAFHVLTDCIRAQGSFALLLAFYARPALRADQLGSSKQDPAQLSGRGQPRARSHHHVYRERQSKAARGALRRGRHARDDAALSAGGSVSRHHRRPLQRGARAAAH